MLSLQKLLPTLLQYSNEVIINEIVFEMNKINFMYIYQRYSAITFSFSDKFNYL